MTDCMAFAAHIELDGYLADLRDPAMIPVLGQAGDRLPELVELLDTRPPNGHQDRVGDVVVMVPPGSAAAPVGAALAERVGGNFMECALRDLSAGVTQAQYVVMAGLADELTLEVVLGALDVTAEIRRSGRGEAALGILLGRSLDELSWLIAKGLSCRLRVPPEHAQLCVARLGEQIEQDGGEPYGTRWVVGADARAEVLLPLLTRQRHGLVSFAASGREHAVILTDTVVCGADTEFDARIAAIGGLPACAFSRRCFREGVEVVDVIRASEIRADVVYANSCMSWRPGHGLVASGYQLTNAFQGGIVAAFIGAAHQMVPDNRLNQLVHRAAADGASVGQLGILLNQQVVGHESPHYVVLGIPWVVPVRAAEAVPLSRIAPLRTETGSSRDAAVRVHLRQAGRAIQALRDLPLAGFLPAENLAALDAEVNAVVADLMEGPSMLRPVSTARSAEHLLDLLADAEFGVALDFYDFWQLSESPLNELWMDFLETSTLPGTERCPYCAGPAATVTGRHPAYRALGRKTVICHTCGPLLDLPDESLIETITIGCPPVWPSPTTVEVNVTIAPARGLTCDIAAAAAIQVAKASVRGLHVPEPQRVRLCPGTAICLRAQIDVEEHAFAHHEHFVRVIVVADGHVHGASRPVAIRPNFTIR
jgi:hypothetical protein